MNVRASTSTLVALFCCLLVYAPGIRANYTWANWDQRQVCYPQYLVSPKSEADIADAIKLATSHSLRVRVSGDGHSFSPIVLTDGVLLKMDNFNSVVAETDDTITVQAGIRLFQLNAHLQQKGKALANLGAIAQQTITGATQTNTHGTGNTGGLATFIVDFRIMLADGSIIFANATTNPDLFNAGRVGMGVFGVILTLTLRTVPIWTMERLMVPMPLSELMAQLPALRKQYERLQWFWTPYTTSATLLLRVNTSSPVTTGCWGGGHSTTPVTPPPSGWSQWPNGTSACVDVSYRALTGSGDDATLYTEMEMMVDAAHDVDVVKDFISFQESVKSRHSPQWGLFTGVRYVEPDDIWLSPFYQRATAVISMIVFGNATTSGDPNEVMMYDRGLEAVAFNYLARPHPGKNNYFTFDEMVRVHPRLDDFVNLRHTLDPHGMFSNAYTERLLSVSGGESGGMGWK
eukprot:gnl/Spiro4/23909_TR11833_c0_g1_i1.p1 gnl/Spiro4/23909_TR11833_c0_g1~~gnl/Spiro4/23909_TR11833_c0_g1_i1.p1  ORF type:complete len:460 (-),score=106.50 gnl/Spiro4/23909_TR11833_c0_g1_i1:134-1513(-)